MLFIPAGLAQPDRKTNNSGVDKYNSGDFFEAEQNFKKGLEAAPESFIANFNLGDALYKQEKFDEAINHFQSSLSGAENDLKKAKVHHNIGNAFLKSNKIKESIEAYKTALKLNPDDPDTKYNLSYALSLLNNEDQQQNQDEKNDRQQNNNNDKQNQNQDQQQNNDEQKNDQQNQPQPQDQESQQDNTKQPQPQETKISKQDAERILEALKNNEKDLQKELRKKTGRPVKTDKDW
jgi:tetratricopeptide (TPR) repeat protein